MPTAQEILALITAGAIASAGTAVALYEGEPRAVVTFAARDGGPSLFRTESLCDGVDNDADGETDEGFKIGDGCLFATGACRPVPGEPTDGLIVCSDDELHGVCIRNVDIPVTRVPGVEIPSNGRDDDCDGATDEG